MVWSTKAEWLALEGKMAEGTFDPSRYNWAVGENRIPVNDANAPGGWKYEARVCVYIMGDGSQQCYGEFPLKGVPSPEVYETARKLIRSRFGIERIINGVG